MGSEWGWCPPSRQIILTVGVRVKVLLKKIRGLFLHLLSQVLKLLFECSLYLYLFCSDVTGMKNKK